MFQDDYIMRQIELLSRGLAKMLMKKTSLDVLENLVTEEGALSGKEYLKFTLDTMVMRGEIGEAEDLLFESVSKRPEKEYLQVALDFYEGLAGMSEEELNRCNFSRGEVLDGLNDIKTFFE
ncbi:MAG: DUF6483 family protein [Christensenellaceae bacterium]|jgi:hypothetical protein